MAFRRFIFVLLLSQSSITIAQDSSTYYSNFIQTIAAYQRNHTLFTRNSIVRKTDNVIAVPTTFEITDYFKLFDKLQMENGWNLNYIYVRNIFEGEPVFILLRDTMTIDAFLKYYPSYNKISKYHKKNKYLEHIICDGSKESYFQYAVFSLIGKKFGLFWHANYNDLEIVCTMGEINGIFLLQDDFYHFPKSIIKEAREIDPRPRVDLLNEEATVRLVTFNGWEGFVEHRIKFQRLFPHTVKSHKKRTLVPFSCGIQF
jgi:hypothetical protein